MRRCGLGMGMLTIEIVKTQGFAEKITLTANGDTPWSLILHRRLTNNGITINEFYD